MAAKLIFETKHWNIFLSEDQTYLGRNVVELKRVSPSLSDLTDEEFADLHTVIKKYEFAVKKAFGATLCNWTCLMNHVYQKKPYAPHVHWHGRPRYEKPIEFAGLLFEDTSFGYHYERKTNREVSDEVQNKIIDAIKSHI
jgi:diadenosine tetraphosphate (Ap4A) HIT family hydrolase